jgi:protein-tyrosine kinase
MSRMLHALKRIEAQAASPCPQPVFAGVTPAPPVAAGVALASPVFPSCSDDFADLCRPLLEEAWLGSVAEDDTGVASATQEDDTGEASGTQGDDTVGGSGTGDDLLADMEARVDAAIEQLDIAVALDDEQSPAATVASEPAASPYWALAHNILAQHANSGPTVLMFTSPLDGAGTTSTVAGLAPALAEIGGKEVLLVDANFRRPELAACLGVAGHANVAAVLSRAIPWHEALCPTAAPRVCLLPGETLAAEDACAGATVALGELLEQMREHFDLVLVDAPPLTEAEAGLLGGSCSGTYLVVPLGRVTRRMLRESRRVIEEGAGVLLGSIVLGAE